jgi:hypothetical protein
MFLKCLGAYILTWTMLMGILLWVGIKLNKTNQEIRDAAKGGAIFLGLIYIGIYLIIR